MDTGPPLKQCLASSKAAVVSHAAKGIDIDPSAAFTQHSLILAHVSSRLCRRLSDLTVHTSRQILTEIAWNSSKSRARLSSLRVKLGPAVSSTRTSLVPCCPVSSVGAEFSKEDGSISGARRVSCSNTFANATWLRLERGRSSIHSDCMLWTV